MRIEKDGPPPSERPRAVRWLGLYALLGGLASLLGWALDAPALTDWYRNGISIQPNAAVAAIASGAALLLLGSGRRSGAAWLGALVAAIGISSLFQWVSGVDLPWINTPLMFGREWGRVGVVSPGRMGPPGSTSWALIGLALGLASAAGGSRRRQLASLLAIIPLFVATLSITGYLYGSDRLYRLPFLTVIALQTATFITGVSLGVVASIREFPPMRWLAAEGPVGQVARRGVWVVVLLPIVIGWMVLQGEHRRVYDSKFGIAILVFALIALLVALLWWAVAAVSRHESALRSSEEERRGELEALRRLQVLSNQMVRAGDLQPMLDEVLIAAADLTGTDMGDIQVFDPASGRLRIAVHRGLSAGFTEFFAEDGWEATCGEAARSRDRVVIQDVALQPRSPQRDVVLAEGIRAIQSTPVVSRRGELLGVLNTHYRSAGRPSEIQLRHLDVLARLAADITERSRNEEAVREADRRKDEFLAILAHELRNPLAPIRSAVEIFQRPGVDAATIRSTSEMLERQVDQMVRLVDDLLDLSRITRGTIEIHPLTVELAPILDRTVEAFRFLTESLGHRLELQLPSAPIRVKADIARLTQVFGNLLHNACKFMTPGGRIHLSAASEDGQAVIRVRDEGVGIPADQLGRVFEMFTQVDPPAGRAGGGLGIGLTLVKSLVELHGGRVEVHSAGRGLGSEFVVRLPIADAPADAASPRVPAVSYVPAGRRILVVDDNEDAARSLSMLLEMAGHTTRTAHDGLDALRDGGSFEPEVVLLDIGLPGLDGYEVCRRIRKTSWGGNAVVVALTGWGQAEDRRRSFEAGFDHHLVKPLHYGSIAAFLATLDTQGRRRKTGERDGEPPAPASLQA